MQTVKELAKIGLCFAGILALGAFVWLCIQERSDSRSITDDLHSTASEAQQLLASGKTVTDSVNVAIADKNNGLGQVLTRARKATLAFEKMADVVRQAGIDERDAMQETGDETVKLVKNLNIAVTHTDTHANRLLDVIGDNVDDLTDHADDSLDRFNLTLGYLKDLLQGPVKGTLENAEDLTGYSAKTMQTFSGKVDAWAHPTRRQKILDITWGALGLARSGAEFCYYSGRC